MDIFEYAREFEKEAEAYYRELAGKVSNKGLKNIFNWLVSEEIKHQDILRKMKENITVQVLETNILKNAKEVFERMKEEKEEFSFDNLELESYRQAQKLEQKSKDFYLQKSQEAENKTQGGVFLSIAKEEEKHYFLLENIIDFVSRPQTWLENAEFCHLEEY